MGVPRPLKCKHKSGRTLEVTATLTGASLAAYWRFDFKALISVTTPQSLKKVRGISLWLSSGFVQATRVFIDLTAQVADT
jgi:hypothetical protein